MSKIFPDQRISDPPIQTLINVRATYSLCEVFKKEVFRISLCCESPSYKYYLIMI